MRAPTASTSRNHEGFARDLEGNDNGAGWLASGLLAEDLRSLIESGGQS
jgi:hypothetical protein